MKSTVNDVPPRTGEGSVDAEHDLPMQLLDSLSQAIEKGTDLASIKHVLEQFIEFSDMHFLSEQLSCAFTAIRATRRISRSTPA